MSSHAILSPSSAGRWTKCPGSLWISKGEVDQATDYAQEGTTAHALAELCLKSGAKAESMIGQYISSDSNIPVDDEMVKKVQEYVDSINKAKNSIKEILDFEVERKLDFTHLLNLSEGMEKLDLLNSPINAFGTADVIIVGDNQLQVHDLKYGKGVRVDAEDNTQMLIYALAAYSVYSLCFPIHEISMHIHQPRLNHYSEAKVSPEDLYKFGEFLKDKALRAYKIYLEGPESEEDFLVGESQCRFCKGSGKCEALSKHVSQALDRDFKNLDEGIKDSVSDLNLNDLSAKYKAIPLIEIWIAAISKRVFETLEQGGVVEGFKLVQGPLGKRTWKDANAAEALLKSFRLKKDEIYKTAIISPTQAKELVKNCQKRIDKIEEITIRSEGKPIVRPSSDKRPPIDIGIEFKDLTQEENK